MTEHIDLLGQDHHDISRTGPPSTTCGRWLRLYTLQCEAETLWCLKCDKPFCPACENTPEDINLCAKCRAKEIGT